MKTFKRSKSAEAAEFWEFVDRVTDQVLTSMRVKVIVHDKYAQGREATRASMSSRQSAAPPRSRRVRSA